MREGEERREKRKRGERREEREEGERRGKKKGKERRKREKGGQIHLSHLVAQNSFRNKFLCKNMCFDRERKDN